MGRLGWSKPKEGGATDKVGGLVLHSITGCQSSSCFCNAVIREIILVRCPPPTSPTLSVPGGDGKEVAESEANQERVQF